ncbi:MAG: hypothetical protein E7Z89_03640 [Cyanobacteria bacterium SIG28]|nr:hypothetical protein [Cyanobacteria bacterium SIG28]
MKIISNPINYNIQSNKLSKTNINSTNFKGNNLNKIKLTSEFYLPTFDKLNFIDKLKYKLFGEKKLINEIANQIIKLYDLGLNNSAVANIFSKILSMKLKTPETMMMLVSCLTSEIPEDNRDKASFTRKRFEIFSQHSYEGEFDKRYYDLTNNLYKKYPDFSTTEIKDLVLFSGDILTHKFADGSEEFFDKSYEQYGKKVAMELMRTSYYYNTDISHFDKFIDFKPESPLEILKNFRAKSSIFPGYFKEMLPLFNECKSLKPDMDSNYLSNAIQTMNEAVQHKNYTEFFKESLDDEFLSEYFKYGRTGKMIDPYKILLFKNLRPLGWSIEDLDTQKNTYFYPDYENLATKAEKETYLNTIKKLSAENPDINKRFILNLVNSFHANYSNKKDEFGTLIYPLTAEKMLNLRKCAMDNLDNIADTEDFEIDDIDELILGMVPISYELFKLLGENNIKHVFLKGATEIDQLFVELGNYDSYDEMFEPIEFSEEIVEALNPTESLKYKDLVRAIAELKEELKAAEEKDKNYLIKKINQYTFEKNQMLKNSIKDPEEAIKTAYIYKTIYENDKNQEENEKKYLVKFKPFLKNLTKEEIKERNKFLNRILSDIYDYKDDLHPSIFERFDLSNSKFIPLFFKADNDFKNAYKNLITQMNNIINSYQLDEECSNLEIFNLMPHNIETQKQFKREKINYNKYTKFNPNSKIEVKIDLFSNKTKSNILKNFKADFNDELWAKIPQKEFDKLLSALRKENYNLIEIEKAEYDNDGLFIGYKKTKELTKNGELVRFEDLSNIVKIFKEVVNHNPFWVEQHKNPKIETAKNTIKNHILILRYNEIKNVKNTKNSNEMIITIQKADMNNIQHALNLGGDSGCCTAIDSCNAWTAPNYILNKLISAIEIKDGENFVGNTMCYFARIDGELSLVLDNIETKAKYQYNDQIRDGIIEYAKKLTKEVGKPNIPIYAGPNRHKINTEGFEFKEHQMKIIGTTEEDADIYLDFDTQEHKITDNKKYQVKLYRLS